MLCFLCVVPLQKFTVVICKVENPKGKERKGKKDQKKEKKNRPQTKALFGEAGRRAISPFGNSHFVQASPS